MIQDTMIPVAAPSLTGNEKAYVLDCLNSTWISSVGPYVDRFEAAFAAFCGTKHAVSCSNGTTALHLALHAMGVGPGDEVIVPTLTFVATANTVVYCGARPVFVDADPETWTMDPAQIEAVITPRTRGIIPVHFGGHPADMDAILDIARRYNLFVLEDAAQAHGAECKGRRVGSLGDAGVFSFFANKIITTGEGGMVVTDDEALASHARLLKSHGMDPKRRYWHPVLGFNYRMTNIAAAIGLAQLERIEWQLQCRRELFSWYVERLQSVEALSWQIEQDWARSVWWMFTIVLDERLSLERDEVIAGLGSRGIDARPVVYPMHMLPMYDDAAKERKFPTAERIALRGINLPTWAGLKRDDVDFICDSLLELLS